MTDVHSTNGLVKATTSPSDREGLGLIRRQTSSTRASNFIGKISPIFSSRGERQGLEIHSQELTSLRKHLRGASKNVCDFSKCSKVLEGLKDIVRSQCVTNGLE